MPKEGASPNTFVVTASKTQLAVSPWRGTVQLPPWVPVECSAHLSLPVQHRSKGGVVQRACWMQHVALVCLMSRSPAWVPWYKPSSELCASEDASVGIPYLGASSAC